MTNSEQVLPTAANPGPFGHKLRESFLFPEGFTQYNQGSYGTFPKVVEDSYNHWHAQSEKCIDRWMRRELNPHLRQVREQLGEYLNCSADELALVTNTTQGINTVLRSLDFLPGDRILQLSTGYLSVDKTIRYICDSLEDRDVKFIEVPITFPLSDKEIVDRVRQAIEDHKNLNDGTRIRIGVVDWISSVPSILHPVKELVELLKSYGILAFVDGAHSIGQVPVDLTYLDADFFIGNCHKWLYSVRGSAALYIAKKHQHKIHTNAISHGYKAGFEEEFAAHSTQDYSSLMTIPTALEFRKQFGEDAIIHYARNLALEGGKRMAEILGTEVLTPYDNQVANMVNVRLPLKDINHPKLQGTYIRDTLLDKYDIFVPSYVHGGKFWTRISAQIFLELQDFEKLAYIWKEIIDELNAE